mmetsp:Transcript_151601/g.263365  ORF Transcript_151601/g.263365 Transcript_151601/m.263365 type:complete len:460 (+) Transcript_151601:47-1426(+)
MGGDPAGMAQAKAEALQKKILSGQEAQEEARQFLAYGTQIPDGLVLATIGNRPMNKAPCPETLRLLLEKKANANATDEMTKGPVIHTACWHDSLSIVKLLLEFRADIESKEQRMNTPPLNTALAAGSAKVCLELLNRNADVTWTHHDGATPLHVAVAWIASTHNSQLRMPPVGEEPVAVISMMLHNGVDPTKTEGMTKSATRGTGMTPLETFRREVSMSPWRSDPTFGPKFDKTARSIYTLLEQGEAAIKYKVTGNKAFAEHRYDDALKAYEDARKVWQTANIRGHHVAVLWSNDAQTYRKMEKWEKCKNACEQGMEYYATGSIPKKLQENLKEATAKIEEAEKAEREGRQVEEKPAVQRVPRNPPTKMKDSFLTETEEPLYTEPSKQGKVDNPGPFICHFEDAKEAGFVDGVDGWKDRQKREEQALDKELVADGLMSEDLLDDPKSVEYINRLPPGVG